jgi:hypothetical protein
MTDTDNVVFYMWTTIETHASNDGAIDVEFAQGSVDVAPSTVQNATFMVTKIN